MSANHLALLCSALALLGVVITAVLARRTGKEANDNTDESNANAAWAALASAHQAEMSRLSGRLDKVEADLIDERKQRQSLAAVLRSAWTHILRLGDQVRTLGGDPAPPPADLTAWMHHDGLIVDRVETTISRTTVTDTRTPNEAPLEVEDVRPSDDQPDL